MVLPKFLLADNSSFPEDIFILHTEFPRFLINLKDDEIEWFEDLSGERGSPVYPFPGFLLGPLALPGLAENMTFKT